MTRLSPSILRFGLALALVVPFVGHSHAHDLGDLLICPDCGCDKILFSPLYHGTAGNPVCYPLMLFADECTSSSSPHTCTWVAGFGQDVEFHSPDFAGLRPADE